MPRRDQPASSSQGGTRCSLSSLLQPGHWGLSLDKEPGFEHQGEPPREDLWGWHTQTGSCCLCSPALQLCPCLWAHVCLSPSPAPATARGRGVRRVPEGPTAASCRLAKELTLPPARTLLFNTLLTLKSRHVTIQQSTSIKRKIEARRARHTRRSSGPLRATVTALHTN